VFNFLNRSIRYAQRSSKWSKIRKEFLANNNYCAACGSKDKKLEVHHKIPVHVNPDLELDLSNLITLCADPCHLVFGHLMNFKHYNNSVEKDTLVYLNKVKNRK
jgi:5-methylcytosine-specific restriction endonuclease McrA